MHNLHVGYNIVDTLAYVPSCFEIACMLNLPKVSIMQGPNYVAYIHNGQTVARCVKVGA